MKRNFAIGVLSGSISLAMLLMVLSAVGSVSAQGINASRLDVSRPNAIAAAFITVTTTTDELINNGLCSLREAISSANRDLSISGCTAGSGVDTIVVPAGLYRLTITGTSELNNLNGALDISTSLTISGSGAALTILEGGPTEGIFHFHGTLNAQVRGVTVRNGHGAPVWNGVGSSLLISNSAIMSNTTSQGAIRNQSILTLTNSSVYSNSGGGIVHSGNDLTLINSLVLSNTSTGGVAGIDGGSGRVTIISSTIANNVAGTGIAGVYANGPLLIIGSQIARNRSTGNPGGLNGFSDAVTISNSQIVSNTGTVGGISSFGNMTVTNSRIANNVAITNYGGGLLNVAGTMLIQNSIIFSNAAPNGGGLANGYGVVIMTGSQVLSNTADRAGGIGNAGVITISNSTIAGNIASTIGGGFANDSGFVVGIGVAVIQNSTLRNNAALLGGGIANGGVLTLTNGVVKNNVAGLRGGGITIGNGSTFISGTQLLDNVAPLGAGLYQIYDTQYGTNTSRSRLINVLIQGNSVGGLVMTSGTLTITRSTLNTNNPNCSVTGGTLVSQGNNTSNDGSCAAWFTQPSDSNGVSYKIYLPLVLKNF